MAMQDPILFTGRELNFEIPEFKQLNAASERLNAKLEKREDMQQKLRDEMRKGMRIDSHTFVADFARKQQFEAVTDFENKWTKITRERGNRLTNDDLLEMENDKAAIARLQNDWLTSQKLWERDDNLVQKSPGDFDVPKHVAATEEFLTTGVYQPGALEFSGIDMANYFSEEKWSGTASSVEDAIPGANFNTFTKTDTNATEAEAREHIVRTLFGDKTGRALKGVIQDFAQESPETKLKYLGKYDKNGDKVISDEELASATNNVKVGGRNMMDNPIIQYAQDKYLPNVRKTKTTTDKQRAARATGTGTAGPNVTFTETLTNPDGTKGTIVYKGAEAQAKIEEAKAKKTEVPETVAAPWDDASLYTPPKESNGGYSFDALAPLPINFKDGDANGKMDNGDAIKMKKFVRKYGQPTVSKFIPPDKFVLTAGGVNVTLSKTDLAGAGLEELKVSTPEGTKTIAELSSGGTNTPTAELDDL